MGPGGPLVRFDQSFSPSSSSARTAVRQRRSTPANGGSPRAPEGRDGSARPGRSSRWSLGRRGRSELPAASFAAEEASGAKWVWGYGGSRPKLSPGLHSREGGRAPGGESGEGEAQVALEWPGQWRRLRLPEMGKETSPGRLAANGGPREMAWDSCVRIRARGSLNR